MRTVRLCLARLLLGRRYVVLDARSWRLRSDFGVVAERATDRMAEGRGAGYPGTQTQEVREWR